MARLAAVLTSATIALGAVAGHAHGAQVVPAGWQVICGAEGAYLVHLDTGERRPLNENGHSLPGGCHGLHQRSDAPRRAGSALG
ncbi:MAG: hypothetical protein OIF48_13750 [Silicimonas sp.]|nr:hypothetical protein [Silicimonas sp.]